MNKAKIKQLERIEKIKEILKNLPDLVEIKYNGITGNVDAYYYPEEQTKKYLLYFNGYEILVNSVEEAIITPFMDGKSFSEVTKDVRIYRYGNRMY